MGTKKTTFPYHTLLSTIHMGRTLPWLCGLVIFPYCDCFESNHRRASPPFFSANLVPQRLLSVLVKIPSILFCVELWVVLENWTLCRSLAGTCSHQTYHLLPLTATTLLTLPLKHVVLCLDVESRIW